MSKEKQNVEEFELAGLPLLTEVAKPLVKVIESRLTEEIRFILGFRKELKDLEEKIHKIAGILDSMTPLPNAALEQWLRKTLRIIHAVENLLDVLAYEKDRSVVMKRRSKKITRLVISPLERAYCRCKMSSWFRRINSNIEAALKEAHTINGLKALVGSASLQPAAINISNSDQVLLQQVRRNVDTSLFVGRDTDVDSVVDMLLSNPHDQTSSYPFSVVAIVGMGGLGKTTLAKKVCENEMVLSHFSEIIWISDLKDFNIERILNKMVELLGIGNHEDAGFITALRELEGCLGGKRYLLVLDDVWNTDQHLWDSMRSALAKIGGSKDSMVLTTTRDEAVARAMHASVHHLSVLSEDASWLLFKKIAFSDGLNGDASALMATGRKILTKCNGVPLAINSISGLLHNRRNPHEWAVIEQSELWDIPHLGTGVLPSLKLSYNHLSPMLKKCFSSCAFMPKGSWFGKYDLICRWMALGLIQNSGYGNITMEDVGENYLNELSSISFLLVKGRNELGEAVGYILHDLVYDLARSVAMHERLYLEARKQETKAVDIQHLTVYGHAEITSDFPGDKVFENIRSLDMLYNIPRGLLVHVKYLRVLSLKYSTIEVVPKSIAKLKCLKYLDLEDNPIKLLPDCIMGIYSLQSLSLYKCNPLIKIPRGLSNLVNLRHLGLSFRFCPGEEGVIGQLSQLQTLPPLQLSEGGFQISELGCLHHLKGTLDIKGLELIKNKLDAENSKFSMKSRVDQLLLSWDSDDNWINHEEVLGGLHPNPNLKVLSIMGYGGDKFPSWLMRLFAGTLCNLIKIELIDCKRCQQLPTMGHLPLLKLIEIRNMENLKQIGPELYGDADLLFGNLNQVSSSGSSPHVKSMVNFQSLKELRLSWLCDLEEWCEPGSGTWSCFPSLEVLVIEKCPRLRKAPNNFPIIKELVVKDMCSSYPLISIMSNRSSLSCLKKLDIQRVLELTDIPEEMGQCTSLQTLIIKKCWRLIYLPDSLSKLVSLEVLEIEWCPKLMSIPNLSCLVSLRELDIFRNDGLRGAPEGLESCKSLEKLWIRSCSEVETLPDLAGLSCLRNLSIIGMYRMIRQPPDWLYKLPSLSVLHIGNYEGLEEFPDISCLLKITSLEVLSVYGWEELQSLSEQLQHFTLVKKLRINDFDNVECLPGWLGNLSSLEDLYLSRCKRLKKLPSKEAMYQLPNFRYLEIEDCPLLEQAINRHGPEYHKIACPHIEVQIINSTF